LRITVITPVFPTQASPHQGMFIHNTVQSLRRLAHVDVVKTAIAYPFRGSVHNKASQFRLENSSKLIADGHLHCLSFPGIPLITRFLNGQSCQLASESHINSLDPDLILAFWTYPEGYAAWKIGRRLNIPVIVGALGSDLLVSKGIGRHFTKQAVKNVDRVLTVSDDLRAAAISMGTPPERVRTIPNGSDPAIFYRRDRAASRNKLGVDLHAHLVLFVGHLSPLKGIPELIAAFSQVRQKIANAELICIGEGPLKHTLSATHLGGIRTLGSKSSIEIADWLGACDLLCLPSRSEGCPNVVVEALASGRAVVATRVGGTPELIDDKSGILVPFGDVSRLSRAICVGLEQTWDEDAIAKRMSRSWDQVAEETYAVCREVLAERYAVARVISACPIQ
jgi:teichuronic acid biosynthesis glycosyltransferase TuaC